LHEVNCREACDGARQFCISGRSVTVSCCAASIANSTKQLMPHVIEMRQAHDEWCKANTALRLKRLTAETAPEFETPLYSAEF
jgi:hypothetical protein